MITRPARSFGWWVIALAHMPIPMPIMMLILMPILMPITACNRVSDGGGIETETFSVAGALKSPDGSPAWGARVSVRPASHLQGARTLPGPTIRDTLADANGKFMITGLPVGEYTVEARQGDSLGLFHRVNGLPVGVVQVKGLLASMGTVRGLLQGADSATRFYLQAYGVARRALVGTDGRYALGLAAGNYQLRITSESSRYSSVEIPGLSVAAGEVRNLADINAGDLMPKEPVTVLFENNLFTGLPDAAALAALHALADNGEVLLLAMATNSTSPWSGPALDAINTYYGHGDLPIGVRKDGNPPVPGATMPVNSYPYAENLATEFPNDAVTLDSLPDAVEVYRKALASRPDSSVVIVSVGVLSNLYNLMVADRELVTRKVRELVILGGTYPSGRDRNFISGIGGGGLPNATQGVVDQWPTRMTFIGPEAGTGVLTGACLEETPAGNPVRKAAELTLGSPAKTFENLDLLAVLYAARGLGVYFTAVNTGYNLVNADGSNEWKDSPDKDQAYLVRSMAASGLAAELDKLICQPPNP